MPHFFLAFLATLGIFMANYAKISFRVVLWFVITLILMTIIGLVASTFSGGDYDESFRATCNFIYDIFTGLGVYFALIQLGRLKIQRIFLIVLLVLIAGSILEVAGIGKSISDEFRASVVKTHLYEKNERDIEDYGGIRPKFFASEPSALGMSIAISFYLWFSAVRRPKLKHYTMAFLLLAVALYAVRTPVIVFGIFAYALTACVTRQRKGGWKDHLYRFIPPAYALGAVLAPSVFLGLFLSASAPAYMMTGSFFSRMIGPFYVAKNVLISQPLFGIGLMNPDALNHATISAYSSTGGLTHVDPGGLDLLGSVMVNAFWLTFVSFGACGTIILALLVRWMLRILKVPTSFAAVSLVVCFTFWQSTARINSPHAWLTFFAVAAICKLRLAQSLPQTPGQLRENRSLSSPNPR
jgi:hypothetical protein